MLKKVLRAKPYKALISTGVLAGALCMVMPSCDDGYEWAQEKPSWLGQSIYDELARCGNFSIYLKMVDDLGRKDFLSKTGSVTVFVADDDTYRAYFKAHGVDENHLSMPMKRYLVNSTMLENAYVLDLLTNQPQDETILKGQVMRRTNTQWSVYDSIPSISRADLPAASVSADYWSGLREEGQQVYNLMDEGTVPMVHFIWRQMMSKGITKSDFSYLFNGTEFQEDDVYINNVKVREGNVACQNGYVHIMEGVPAPLPNMAAYLRTNENTKIFSKLLDRYSAPFEDYVTEAGYLTLQETYAGQNLYPALAGGERIYNRGYFFSSADGNSRTSFNGVEVNGLLKFDPSQNDYAEGNTNMMGEASSNVNLDMGAIFAPTDEALQEYWNGESGAFLRERYPSDEPFEKVPNDVLAEFMNNHMQYSFLSSLPSKFNLVLDDAKDPIGMEPADIVQGSTAVCNNGAVYVMNKAYAPASFRSVLAPTLVNENMRIMNWAINDLEFKPYLLSMVSYYDFLILTDEALSRYIDPVSYSGSDPRWLEFYYNAERNQVEARSYRYDKTVGGLEGCTRNGMQLLESTAVSDATTGEITYQPNPVVENRLTDLLNFCIVPRDISGGNYVGNGSVFFQTKDDGVVRIQQTGSGVTVEDQFSGQQVAASDVVEMDNGKYYVLEQMAQPTFNSLMDELDSHPEYSEFVKLLEGNPEWSSAEESQFGLLTTSIGMSDQSIRTFSSYHYTLYVPDNEAMQKAYDMGLPSWDDINNLDNVYAGTDVDVDSLKTTYTQRVMNFLKYHVQDNAVYIGGDPRNMNYETAATYLSGTQEGLSYTLGVHSDASGITLTDNSSKTPDVRITTGEEGFYNRLVREYTFSSNSKTVNDNISTSSYVVVHKVDEPLVYDDECFCLKDNERVQEN